MEAVSAMNTYQVGTLHGREEKRRFGKSHAKINGSKNDHELWIREFEKKGKKGGKAGHLLLYGMGRWIRLRIKMNIYPPIRW